MKEKKEMVTVPYIAYEKDMEHKNRIIAFLGISLILSILTIAITVYMFMSFINSYDYKNYDQNGDGINNINSGTQGDVVNESDITNKN